MRFVLAGVLCFLWVCEVRLVYFALCSAVWGLRTDVCLASVFFAVVLFWAVHLVAVILALFPFS